MTNLYFSFLNLLIVFQSQFFKEGGRLEFDMFFYVGLTCMSMLTHFIQMALSARKHSLFSVNTIMYVSEYLCYNNFENEASQMRHMYAFK